MRRSLALLVPFIPSLLFAAGCEDGPTQTFSPAPANAGNIWNNGNTPAAVDDASTPLITNTSGGTSKTEICNGAEIQSQWARMVAQPIVPPYLIAGINLSGVNYESITVEQAENGINGMLFPAPGATNPPTRLCQGTPGGSGGNGGDCGGGGGSLVTTWGNNGEFLMEWCVNTHKDLYNSINPGYLGTMEWDYTCEKGSGSVAGTCTDGSTGTPVADTTKHHYVWQLGKQITRTDKNGVAQPFNLNWNGYGTPGKPFYAEADELYRGLTEYFTPDLYDDLPAGVECVTTGRCPAFPTGNSGVYPILGFRTLSMYWEMDQPTVSLAFGSTPHDAYFFNIKYAPYSAAVSYLKMDAVGPTASLNPIGNLTPQKDCELSLGGTFGALEANCINVFSDPNVNATALAKVLGNLSHDDNDFTFSVVGINQNYRPPELDLGGSRQFDIIHDGELPQANALASDFTYDVRANGPILNDRYPENTVGVYGRDNHGAGAVWREYQRLVQTDLAAKLAAQISAQTGTVVAPKTLHDPSCLMPMVCSCTGLTPGECDTAPAADQCGLTYATGFNPNTWRAAPGCTGMEGFITSAFPNTNAQTGLPVDANNPLAIDPSDWVYDMLVSAGPACTSNTQCAATPATPVCDTTQGACIAQFLPPGSTSEGRTPYFGDGFAPNIIPNGLRPGTPYALFCFDPGIYNFCGPGFNGPLQGNYGALLDTSVQQVVQVGGNGDPSKLPEGTGDYRYFFQKWTEAMAEYFGSGAALHTGPLNSNAKTGTANDPVPYFGPPTATIPACNSNRTAGCKTNAYTLNTDDLFFDSFGGNANKGEFVVYDNADLKDDPLDLNLAILLIGTNLQEVHFYKRLDREERAVYEAFGSADSKAGTASWLGGTTAIPANQAAWGLLKDANGVIQVDDYGVPVKNASVFFTNLAGSPTIAGATEVATGGAVWSAALDSNGNVLPAPPGTYDPCDPSATPLKNAQYCATHLDPGGSGGPDPDCINGYATYANAPPQSSPGTIITRPNGDPLLSGYCGIWSNTAFSIGAPFPAPSATTQPVGIQLINADITPEQQVLEQEAEVSIPNYANPYDPTSKVTQIKTLVPWAPQQEGIGFSVPSTGENDTFVETAQLDFSGQVITPLVDYVPTTIAGADGGTLPGTYASIEAYESQDFLGDVFLCYDTVTGGVNFGNAIPGDLLTARMYTSVQDILNWLASHPTTQDNCEIIIRYSPYNNYPDYITSLKNGVKLSIDQGEGAGRVVDVTLYNPALGAVAPP